MLYKNMWFLQLISYLQDKSSAASSPVSSSRGQSPIPAVKQSKPQQVNRKKHTPVPQMMVSKAYMCEFWAKYYLHSESS